jgi:uncharacterized membrane protein YcaP (DUF421 family)
MKKLEAKAEEHKKGIESLFKFGSNKIQSDYNLKYNKKDSNIYEEELCKKKYNSIKNIFKHKRVSISAVDLILL